MGIPTGNTKLKALLSRRLRDEQARLIYVKIIFINKCSMSRGKELFRISERLKQIKYSNLDFGGLCIVLVGDPAQLPPVLAESLWVKVYQVQKLVIEIIILYIHSSVTKFFKRK